MPLCPGATIEKVELSPDSQNVTTKDVSWSAQDPVGQARSGLFAVGDEHAFRKTIKPLTDLPKQFTISVLTSQTTLGGGSELSRVRTASSAPSLTSPSCSQPIAAASRHLVRCSMRLRPKTSVKRADRV